MGRTAIFSAPKFKLTGQVCGHGAGLANHAIGMAVEQAVEQARIAGQRSIGEGGRYGTVLADQHACGGREKGSQQQNEEIEVRHSGEDDVGFELPHEAKEAKGAGADSDGSQCVDGDPWRWSGRGGIGLSDESQVEIVLLPRQASGQQGCNLLRAAAAEMWN